MDSILSQILVFSILIFLAVGSGVLAWDGLALGFGRAHAGGSAAFHWRARVRLAAGLLGVALAIWLAAGYITRVH